MNGHAPIAVALDAPDLETAARWAGLVTPYVSTVKIGLELYLRYGPEAVTSIRGASGVQIFLDLEAARHPGHGGRRRPCRRPAAAGAADRARGRRRGRGSGAAADAAPGTRVVAVWPVLTSLGEADLQRIGLAGPASDAVRRLAALAVDAGARGLVCSPQEVAAVRSEIGDDILLVTPGVRPAGSETHDQARVATPEEALRAGADLLVIGRPITGAADPGAAAGAIAASLRRAEALRG